MPPSQKAALCLSVPWIPRGWGSDFLLQNLRESSALPKVAACLPLLRPLGCCLDRLGLYPVDPWLYGRFLK